MSKEKKDSTQLAWDANHRAVGEAKEAAEACRMEWRDAEAALGKCPIWRRALHTDRHAPPCDCHGPQVFDAYNRYQAAKALIEPAIATFKAGVTKEQEKKWR